MRIHRETGHHRESREREETSERGRNRQTEHPTRGHEEREDFEGRGAIGEGERQRTSQREAPKREKSERGGCHRITGHRREKERNGTPERETERESD